MEQLAVEVVKEFLKEQGLSRTLRAFDASLLTANAVVPGSTGGGKQKKVSKFESPQLSGTDDAVSRMLRMLAILRPSAPPPQPKQVVAPTVVSESRATATTQPTQAIVNQLIDMALEDTNAKKRVEPQPRQRGRRTEEVVIEDDDEDVSVPVPPPKAISSRSNSGEGVKNVVQPASKQSSGSWFTTPEPEPEPQPVRVSVSTRKPVVQEEAVSSSSSSLGMFVPAKRTVTSSLPTKGSDGMLVIDDADEFDDGAVDTTTTKPAAVQVTVPTSTVVPTSISVSGAIATTGTPITEPVAISLRQLLYSVDKKVLPAFHKSWYQGFFFSDVPGLGYGLVQPEGGPCGALAAVQAFTLRHLYFGATPDESVIDPDSDAWKQPPPAAQTRAVTCAIRDIVWRCVPAVSGAGKRNYAVLALRGGRPHFGKTSAYTPDGITETLVLQRCASVEALEAAITANIAMFMEPGGIGIPLVVYSAMLTRGVDAEDGVVCDMDTGFAMGSMIGRHNYATQELVNLLLFGRAHSNVFNGTHVMSGSTASDSITLRGAPCQGEVGFLSLFENYGNIEVGSYMKTPVFPIWVVCSESHYSCMFGANASVLSLNPTAPFDVYYFDGLGRQDEEIKLTITPKPVPPLDPVACKGEDNPPLDLCVRTRWPGAAVDWNGVDPLL